jgi:DNA-binding GntR family transcriptional regulator
VPDQPSAPGGSTAADGSASTQPSPTPAGRASQRLALADPAISRDSLGIQTARWLRGQIVEGLIPPGERVNEVALAQQLSLSRGPIREALQRLEGEGLIEIVPNRGAFVRSFGKQQLADLYDVRVALEMMAARLAAERRTATDIESLRESLAEAKRELELTGSHYPPELDLHRLLVESARNPELARILAVVNQQVRLCRARSGWEPARAQQAFREHNNIVKAVVRADPDAAAAAMHIHLTNALRSIYELFGLSVNDGRN